MNSKQNQVLVIGGTGKTGRRVVDRLEKAGLPYRLGVKEADIPFDWYDESTWANALAGISSIYTVFYPDLAVPGASDIIAKFADVAKAAKVEHIVLLAGRGEEGAEDSEQIVMKSGIDWTIIRSSFFMHNFSENFFTEDILRGEVRLPVPADRAEPFVSVEDIADVAFAALTGADHRGQLYELTGPELLTFPQVLAKISAAIGKTIMYKQISKEDHQAGMREAGLPEPTISLITYLFTEVLDGRNESLQGGVQKALGRAPQSFDDYVKQTAASGVWDS